MTCDNRTCNRQAPIGTTLKLPFSIIDREYDKRSIKDFCSWACVTSYAAEEAASDAQTDADWDTIMGRR